jgi:hypothetical protein
MLELPNEIEAEGSPSLEKVPRIAKIIRSVMQQSSKHASDVSSKLLLLVELLKRNILSW